MRQFVNNCNPRARAPQQQPTVLASSADAFQQLFYGIPWITGKQMKQLSSIRTWMLFPFTALKVLQRQMQWQAKNCYQGMSPAIHPPLASFCPNLRQSTCCFPLCCKLEALVSNLLSAPGHTFPLVKPGQQPACLTSTWKPRWECLDMSGKKCSQWREAELSAFSEEGWAWRVSFWAASHQNRDLLKVRSHYSCRKRSVANI